MLCNLCNNLSLELLNRGGYHHAASSEALEESATNGCELCNLLKTALGRCVATPVRPDSIQGGEFGRVLKEIGRPEGVWLLWNGGLNRVRVAMRRERAGALEDQYAQLHLYTAPGR